jgi:hypothetical protein
MLRLVRPMVSVAVASAIYAYCFLFAVETLRQVMAVSVYVILDIEYPRLGLIRVDAFDQALVDLRNNMK